MDLAIANPQFGTGGFFLRHYKLFSQKDLELQVNPPVAMASAPPFFSRKKKPAKNPKRSPKVVRKGSVNMVDNSHEKGDELANKPPAPPTTPRIKKVGQKPKRLSKVRRIGDVDMVVDSNNKSDQATATGSPEL